MHIKAVRAFIVLGISVPVVLFFLITILSITWPGYDFVNEQISVLGSNASPFQLVANMLIFGFSGSIMVGLALSLKEYLNENFFSINATRFFLASGVLFFILAFIPIDRGFENISNISKLHSFIVSTASLFLFVSILWYAQAFRKDERWGSLWIAISYIAGFVSLFSALIIKFYPNYYLNGVIERVAFGVLLLWVCLVSINCFLVDQLEQVNL